MLTEVVTITHTVDDNVGNAAQIMTCQRLSNSYIDPRTDAPQAQQKSHRLLRGLMEPAPRWSYRFSTLQSTQTQSPRTLRCTTGALLLLSATSKLQPRQPQATHRPLSSSFFWIIFRILEGNPKKELLRGLRVATVFAKALCDTGFGPPDGRFTPPLT